MSPSSFGALPLEAVPVGLRARFEFYLYRELRHRVGGSPLCGQLHSHYYRIHVTFESAGVVPDPISAVRKRALEVFDSLPGTIVGDGDAEMLLQLKGTSFLALSRPPDEAVIAHYCFDQLRAGLKRSDIEVLSIHVWDEANCRGATFGLLG